MPTQTASMNYKNSYKATKKELVSLSVYNVGYQKCDALHQWGPGVRDHYLIHYVISGCGHYEQNKKSYELHAGDAFLVYPNQEITYYADVDDPWEYAWVGFNGSDALSILNATDFTKEHPYITDTPFGEQIRHQLMCIYEVRGNEFEQADGCIRHSHCSCREPRKNHRRPPTTAMCKKRPPTSAPIIPIRSR